MAKNKTIFKKGHKTNLGKTWRVSKAGKKAMGEGQKGKVSGFKGKKHTEKSKLKNKLKHLGIEKSPKAYSFSKGNKNPNWKGGITPRVMKVRNSAKYQIWRNAVYLRDNFTCQDCGMRGCYIEAHHKISFSKLFGTENHNKIFEINNGLTLCIPCHNETKLGGATNG